MSAKHRELDPPVNAEDHVEGNSSASITLVEYGDYECPHCGRAYPIVKRLQARLGSSMRFVFRNFPLAEAHPHAEAAAEMAEAAASQDKFWPMHDTLFEHQDALDDAHLSKYASALHLDLSRLQAAIEGNGPRKRVRSDFVSGVRSGVNGTPTFFINGRRFDGDWTDESEFAGALQYAVRQRV
jgi:protein-disulfide isomerase